MLILEEERMGFNPWVETGAYEQEHATPLYFCLSVFIDRFIFKSNLLWMRLPWECHNQSQDTNWSHCVTGPELPFFHKRKGVLKIDQSVKMPWHRLSMGVASSWLLVETSTLLGYGQHSPVPELSFRILPAPYRGWTRAGERRVQDNLHAHAPNEPIKNY